MEGKYIVFIPSCSFSFEYKEGIIGVTMVTLYQNVPLLAYVATCPE